MAVLECLKDNSEHPSADDLFREVRKQFPTISLATVYNTLEMLKRRGEVMELTIDSSRRRYDPETTSHHHLICTGCGMIVDIGRQFRLCLDRREREGFEVRGNHIEFYGVCPECLGREVDTMAEFRCDQCGATKEGRCKPKKCAACGASGTMQKEG
jgi:Fur family peroxide stress response transcriptional regulator